MEEKKEAFGYRSCRIAGILLILFALTAYFVLIMKNGANLIDSDDASELVLARLLAGEHVPISPDWLYSYELRVLNIQLVFMPLFWIFDSWKLIRALGGVILLIIYVLSYYSVFAAFKLDKRFFYLTAFSLIMPYAEPLQFFSLKLYYIPHVSISFVALALFGLILSAEGKKRTVLCVILYALAFIAGLGGTRSILLTFIPMCLAGLIMFLKCRESINTLAIQGIALFSSGVGFIINDRLLTRIFHYRSYSSLSFIRLSFERLEAVANSILASFGYSAGPYFMSPSGILDAFALLITLLFFVGLYIVFRQRDELSDDRLGTYYYIALTFLLNTAVVIFSQLVNDEYADRYITIGIVPCILLVYIAYPVLRLPERFKRTLFIGSLAGVLLMGLNRYVLLYKYSGNSMRQGYIEYLTEQGLDYGYAPFWHANVTTELSNGKIDMTALAAGADSFELYDHLGSLKLLKQHHDKSFLLIETRNAEDFYLGGEPVTDIVEPSYQDDAFSVFVFDLDLDEKYSE